MTEPAAINGSFPGLKDKTALVVGASSGIGEATARLFARGGSKVCLVARRADRLDSISKDILAEGGRCQVFCLDVTEESAAEACFNRAKELYGPPDYLVLTAGTGLLMPAAQTNSEAVRKLLELNTLVAFRFCREGYFHINRGGSIILITSPAGVGGAAGVSAYALSKGGLGPFARSIAREYARKGIRVNLVSPGYVKTEMSDRLYGRLTAEQLNEAVIARHPLGPGSAADVAQAIAFLCSDSARWITGALLPVDGGYSAGHES